MVDDFLAKPQEYQELLSQLVVRIRDAQHRAVGAVNRATVLLYWGIGKEILVRQRGEGWGAKVIDRLAADLQRAFPGVRGLSSRNLKYMRAFAKAWPDKAIVQQLLHNLPWTHLCLIHDKARGQAERDWYVRACVEHGWSRSVLKMQLESGLHRRRGEAVTNFERTLSGPESDLAREMLKDPYNFDFLTLAEPARERAIERALIDHIRDFLLELGRGVVIELKGGAFRPEHAGKLNFYLSAADDLLRHPDDNRTIGLLLCRDRNRVVAEYALRGLTQPLGVTEYELTTSLPDRLAQELPTVKQLEQELGSVTSPEGRANS